MFDSPDDVLTYLRDNAVRYVDLRFCDLLGAIRQFTVPVSEIDAGTFTDGLAFDGSSILGFAEIHESDMLLVPDAATAVVDPFRREKTLNLTCSVRDPLTHEPYGRDPRGVAMRAEEYLAESGIADAAYFGPEAEFYLFDSVRYDTGMHEGYYHVDSAAGAWNTGRSEEGRNLGYKVPRGGGYFLVPPHDQFADTRDQITTILTDLGIRVERAHHEVGTAGQTEINYRFDSLLRAADTLMLFKYVVRNVAFREGRTATFMPKPLHDDNGSGMHCHQSLWRDGQPLFHDEMGYAGLSDTARFYIGGLLAHAPSLLAFTNPTTNSYRRLVPGHEAPISLVYSQRNRSACCRIPVTGTDPRAKRLEFRAPDPQANPYLAFPAMLMAGLDGIRSKTEPPAPIDKDLYELPPEEATGIATVPTSLEDALSSLAADHEYLLEGGVFTEDLIATWIERKRAEVDALRLRPHPYEFQMYYDL